MPELRVDPLTGLRVIMTPSPPTHGAAASDDLYTSIPDRIVAETVTGGPEAWRTAMRAHPDAACLHVAAGDADTADLYALDFVPAAVARERERFSAYATRTMGGNLLGDLVQEEVRRRERLVAVDDEAVVFAPYASRVPYQLLLAPRTSRGRFQDDGPARRRAARRRRRPPRPPARPVGPHRPARRRALLLADRHRPPRRGRPARARDRVARQPRASRGRRRRAAHVRALVQRVAEASVTVEGERVAAIGAGLLVLLGVTHGDDADTADRLADKVRALRVFADAHGKMNEALGPDRGVLVVSQFTLYGETRKGNRPSYVGAARPDHAEPLYERFADRLDAQRGVFGAHMDVALVNDGPVTLMMEL